ncbi:MAG: PAS domain S-box protein [Candidatus Eremiobacterota bacterium]
MEKINKPVCMEQSYENLLKKISKTTGFSVFFIGIFVFLTWKFNIFMSFHHTFSPMSANTAFSFILTGMSLWILQTKKANVLFYYLGKICAFLVFLIAIITIAEYLFNVNLYIDELLCKQNYGFERYPGRMSPSSALNFMLVGMAIIFLYMERPAVYRPARYIILMVGVNSFLSVIGYLFGIVSLFTIGFYKPVALHSAICFLLVSISLICSRQDRGFMKILTGSNAAAYMLRYILYISFSIPLLLSLLCFFCRIGGIYSLSLSLFIVILSNITVFIFLLYISSHLMNNLEVRFNKVSNDLKISEEKFHSLVSCAQDAIIILEEGKIVFCNDSAIKIFGYSYEEVNGKEFHMFLSSNRYSPSEKLDISMINTGEEYSISSKISEFVALKKNGQEFSAELSITAVKLDDKWTTIGIIRDVSKYKKYSEKLEKNNEEMEKTVNRLTEELLKISLKLKEAEFQRVNYRSARDKTS